VTIGPVIASTELAIGYDPDVAELGGDTVGSAEQLSAEDDAGADPDRVDVLGVPGLGQLRDNLDDHLYRPGRIVGRRGPPRLTQHVALSGDDGAEHL
jgi:hypothetical protein